jgi:hypothetical protein
MITTSVTLPQEWVGLLNELRERRAAETGTRPAFTQIVRQALRDLLVFEQLLPPTEGR